MSGSAVPVCGRGRQQRKKSREIQENRVDGGLTRVRFLIPRKAGNSPNQEFVLRTFGTANWTQFCPGNDTRKAADRGPGDKVEFFLSPEMDVRAGSLTSTYRV